LRAVDSGALVPLASLDPHTDTLPSLSVDQPLIDFDTPPSQLISTSTTSPVDLLLSASSDQGVLQHGVNLFRGGCGLALQTGPGKVVGVTCRGVYIGVTTPAMSPPSLFC